MAKSTSRPKNEKERGQKARKDEILYVLGGVGIVIIAMLPGCWLGWLGLVYASVVLAIASILATGVVRVSTINYGVVTRFSRRTGRVLEEGLNVVWPLKIERVELVPYELKTSKIDVTVFAKDGVGIRVQGSVQWRPTSPREKNVIDGRKLILSFLEASDVVITNGLTDAVQDELGDIAGATDTDRFIQDRETLGVIIDATLRLGTLPHLKSLKKSGAGLDKNAYTKKEPAIILGEHRLDFYRDHSAKIRLEMAAATRKRGATSVIEQRYGIEIATFALSSIEFDKQTREALEKKRQRVSELAAIESTVQTHVAMQQLLKDKTGVSPDRAYGTVEVLIGAAQPPQTLRTEGLSGGLPIINVNTTTPAKGGP